MDQAKMEEFSREMLVFLTLAHEKFNRLFDAYFKQELSTSQFSVLCSLKAGGEMTMSKLSQRMNMPKQQASKLVARLVESGHIARAYDEKDRRVVLISLTQSAQAYIDREITRYVAQIAQIFFALEDADPDVFLDVLRKINQIMPRLKLKE